LGLPLVLQHALEHGSDGFGKTAYTEHFLNFLSVVLVFFINPAFIVFVVIRINDTNKRPAALFKITGSLFDTNELDFLFL
jgi:hypothetical protein